MGDFFQILCNVISGAKARKAPVLDRACFSKIQESSGLQSTLNDEKEIKNIPQFDETVISRHGIFC